jgi:hypothetical protein
MRGVKITDAFNFDNDRTFDDEIRLETVLELHSFELEGNGFFGFDKKATARQISSQHAFVNGFEKTGSEFSVDSIARMNNSTSKLLELDHSEVNAFVAPQALVSFVTSCEQNRLYQPSWDKPIA